MLTSSTYTSASQNYTLSLHDALPICAEFSSAHFRLGSGKEKLRLDAHGMNHGPTARNRFNRNNLDHASVSFDLSFSRSEERRVGKECRSRCSPYHEKKKTESKHQDIA